MLKIREEQLTTLGRVVDEAFEDRIFAMARRDLAQYVKDLDDDALRARIDEDVTAGHRLGLQGNRAMMKFVGLALMRRPPFYELDAIKTHFRDSGADGDSSMEILFLSLSAVLASHGSG
jgi:sorbitol-specific phosphotransferase system component IIA